ncbi:hypothetical protein KA005_72250 [bacterium]|nr:hypothetical protein [bacterium]
MTLNRRKFFQFAGTICIAPVFNKIDGLVTANVDSCVPEIPCDPGHLFWDIETRSVKIVWSPRAKEFINKMLVDNFHSEYDKDE